jgi:hypothetical protein
MIQDVPGQTLSRVQERRADRDGAESAEAKNVRRIAISRNG